MSFTRLFALPIISASFMTLAACGQTADNPATAPEDAMSSDSSGAMDAQDSMSNGGAMSDDKMMKGKADPMKNSDKMANDKAMKDGDAMADDGAMKDGSAMTSDDAMDKKQ